MKELYLFQVCLCQSVLRNTMGTSTARLRKCNILKCHTRNVTKKCYPVLRFAKQLVCCVGKSCGLLLISGLFNDAVNDLC